MREEGERIMRKRDEAKNRREIIHALSMIMQIGLSMMVCMSVSLLIGYGLDKLFGTKCFMVIMMFIGILASLRSMLVLTGQYHPGSTKKETQEGKKDGDGEDWFMGSHNWHMDSCHCGNSWRHLFCAGAVAVCFGRNRWQYHGEWTYGSFVPEH